ncbi:hypothetical protein CC85DRAFT_267135 [Cutaneotrichosporon oleaginosum]|uniref:Mitochondrial import inner membrane translocase subunit TIM54 n=1 Tax=Cutaneotrichosporon oleaginosum TaxID=879819 RepID=A0A0J1AT06_9TREE|nr:uncharacterized protein CC85DRAFT_267135 [Cutaneotrichosporon oleaginosum]KLT38449.1 hypothetical protein CC85DRAFT_267135 [Cutaneotrichosporon oleaginosum]TXT11914.1 hypothetical protein COLE_02324 [Cutaneotrichosporon oleaginosum]
MATEPPPSGPAPPAAPAAASTKPSIPVPEKPLVGHGPRLPPPPLEGWRGVLQYTGLPRGVLTWKPKLPGPKMTVFLGVVGGLTYLYYDDRSKAKAIREEYIAKVQHYAKEPTVGSLDVPRKVLVYGARWPEDDEANRALVYFRKYIKPYLVAAAVDYEQVEAPLYGSIARIVRADVLRKRREALGLQPRPQEANLGVPPQVAALSAKSEDQRWLEGGVVLVGRPALKEYLAGLRAGWRNGVDAWTWEKEIEDQLEWDTVFQTWVEPTPTPEGVDPAVAPAPAAARTSLFRRAPPAPTAAVGPGAAVPPHLHAPPSPLPPHPPLLLVPWTNYLGFAQIPYMIYNFFTERHRVREGAEAAYALITNQTRAFEGPSKSTDADAHLAPELPADTDFGADTERFYKKDYENVPARQAKQRQDYYRTLAERLESARQFARGERELTDEEKATDKPVVTEDDLRAERRKRELRWRGGREGWEIVRPSTPVAWDDAWAGWLRVFDARTADEIAEAERKRTAAMEK